ncbi:unnamed protein product [Rotaria socialis]|uniref:G-protein coupled receptors family 1 profile domain-containing protein n=1 Tax=Rotaria socialis TaxID=392032 RepID=A0A818P1P9_9BILA|nr:unnamed protein product [Rotaria socialis]CAF3606823.1 unnamed protein product [Rotaria socialis]CAF3615333.1 unnamed protein product [Rotaria socialis]CAF4432652.1 unnamed protein product [Rotaria socialis]CAF4641251.1 unnamed protein product [Rotaria socialis]
MSSSSDASSIAALNNASMQLNRYFGIFILLFGIFGNTMNVCVLSQRALRCNPCAWLFLASSIANGIGLAAGLTSRPLSTWSADLTNVNQFLCKLRAGLLFSGISVGSWLVMLATADRWLASSTDGNLRKKSTLKNAQTSAIIVSICVTLAEAQNLYCFEANLTNTPLKCYTKTVWCSILNDLSLSLITILCPLMLMIIFSTMTILNIRKSRSRLHPAQNTADNSIGQSTMIGNNTTVAEQKKTDRRLSIMLLVQIFLICLFTLPLAALKLYTTMTRSLAKSALRITIENFAFNVVLLVFYLYCGMPFYIYVLSGGRLFRKAIYSFVNSLRQKIMCQRV